MFSTSNRLTRPARNVARAVLPLVLFMLTLAVTAAPSAQASPLATPDAVGHVVRLDGPAVVRIVSVIQAQLVCKGCLADGSDITSPESGTITYASSGSGAFITPDGYVLTADHVVDHGASNPEDVDLIEQTAATDIAQQLNDGKDTPASVYKFLQNHPDKVEIQTTIPFEKVFLSTNYTGTLQSASDIISYDVTNVAAHSPVMEQDTAIIKVNAQDVPYLAIAPANSVNVGDTITAIAFPGDADLALNNADFTALVDPTQSDLNTLNSLLGASVNTGQVTAKKVRSDGTGVYESNGISSQGSSGGPVIDDQGQIIGFVDAGPSTDRLTFLIPSEVISTYVNQAGVSHPSAGTFMPLWTKAANEYDSTASCHWTNAYKDLNTLRTQYPKFGAIQQYLTKAQQQSTGESCATTKTSGDSSGAGLLFLIGCILTLLVIIGGIVLLVVLLSRRKQTAQVPVAVPAGAAYPTQQMAQPAGQGTYPGYPGGYGQPAAPSVPYQPQPQPQPQMYPSQGPAYPTAPQPTYPSQGPAYPTAPQTPAYAATPFYSAPAMAPAAPQMQPVAPVQQAQQPTPAPTPAPAPQTAAAGAIPSVPATPTVPTRRCLNGHIISDPAAIFCPECGAGIQQPLS